MATRGCSYGPLQKLARVASHGMQISGSTMQKPAITFLSYLSCSCVGMLVQGTHAHANRCAHTGLQSKGICTSVHTHMLAHTEATSVCNAQVNNITQGSVVVNATLLLKDTEANAKITSFAQEINSANSSGWLPGSLYANQVRIKLFVPSSAVLPVFL